MQGERLHVRKLNTASNEWQAPILLPIVTRINRPTAVTSFAIVCGLDYRHCGGRERLRICARVGWILTCQEIIYVKSRIKNARLAGVESQHAHSTFQLTGIVYRNPQTRLSYCLNIELALAVNANAVSGGTRR